MSLLTSAPADVDLYEWTRWLGLPHAIGADPREGKAACCVRIALILNKNAGLPSPEPDPEWFDHARAGHWGYCRRLFELNSEPIEEPELWSMAWVTNGSQGFGIGTVVQDNKLLLPHHRRGVMVVPLHLLKKLEYFKTKP